jgi:hypothetical protein
MRVFKIRRKSDGKYYSKSSKDWGPMGSIYSKESYAISAVNYKLRHRPADVLDLEVVEYELVEKNTTPLLERMKGKTKEKIMKLLTPKDVFLYRKKVKGL